MNRKIFIIITFYFLLFALGLNAQDTWLQTYDPFYESIFNVEDVLVCSDGGFAINGTCINQQTTIGWGFVIKTDYSGNLLWAKKDTISFQPENDSRAFVETADGGIISASYHYTNGTLLIKRDINGNREWTNLLEGIKIESITKNIYNEVILSGINFPNAMIAKINENGDIVWQNNFEFGNYEWGNVKSVVASSDGGYLLTGYVETIESENAILVIKTDANGDSLWTRIIDVTSEDDFGRVIIETEENNIIVGGYLEGITAGFLCKLDSEGNTIWLESGQESCGYGFRSFAKANDGSIISYFGDLEVNHSLRKFDNSYYIEWTNNLPYSAGAGDKAIGLTLTQHIVVASFYPSSQVALIKLNPDGTEVNENIIGSSKIALNAYPNPFNPSTMISFNLPENIKNPIIEIFNIKGEKIRIINYQDQMPMIWDGTDNFRKQVSSGIYLYRLKTINFVSKAKKMTLLK